MRKDVGIALPLILWLGALGLVVRLCGLGAYRFSPDDAMHVRVASGGTPQQVWESCVTLTNAPLMYFLLHYLMKVSENEVFLRTISLVPGMGLIFVFFFLGRKASGTVSGLAMACMAVFGNGAILQSQGIRPYGLMVFFLALSLWTLLRYEEERADKYLYAYVASMSLAIFSHYPAILPMVAIGTVWLVRVGTRREGLGAFVRVVCVHLPLLLQVGLLYHFHISKVLRFTSTSRFKPEYMKPYFPETASGLFVNIPGLFEYLFVPAAVPVMIALTVLGLPILWKASRRDLAAIVFATFVVGFVTTDLKIYPFGGSRHSIYLFPFVALSIGGSVQWLFDRFPVLLERLGSAEGMRWLDRHRGALVGLGAACLVLATLALTVRYEKYDFRRGFIYLGGYDEFPLTREDYDEIMNHLKTGLGKDDTLLVNEQTSYYFLPDPKEQDVEIGSERLGRISWEGRDMFILRHWKFGGPSRLRKALGDLKSRVALGEEAKIWVVNIGWRDLLGGRALSEVVSSSDICSELSVLGGFVFSLKGREVLQKMEAVDGSGRRRP
jgi:hypothetical protein